MFAPPAAQLMFDVAGTPDASPGRMDKKPFEIGCTTVTLSNTDVADTGTTNALSGAAAAGGCVATVPVTCNFCDTPDTNGPANPTPVRVSRIRVGVIDTNDDGSDETASTATKPPAPNVTATAAPTAAHRDRHIPDRTRERPFTAYPFRISIPGQPPSNTPFSITYPNCRAPVHRSPSRRR